LSSTRKYNVGDIISVQTELGVIEVTGAHPIWVKAGSDLEHRPQCEHVYENEHEMLPHGRWVNARDLQVGDELLSRSQSALHVLSLNSRNETTTVYNLTVADYHTYAVGVGETLVHNKAMERTEGFKNPADAIGDIHGYAKIVDKVKAKNIEYINKGYTEIHYIIDSNGTQHTVPYNPKLKIYEVSHKSSGW
jgi:hypothetical protein